jgi:hypothetical protein
LAGRHLSSHRMHPSPSPSHPPSSPPTYHTHHAVNTTNRYDPTTIMRSSIRSIIILPYIAWHIQGPSAGCSCFLLHSPTTTTSGFSNRQARRKGIGASSSTSSSIGGDKTMKPKQDESDRISSKKGDGSSKGRRMKKSEIDTLVRGVWTIILMTFCRYF